MTLTFTVTYHLAFCLWDQKFLAQIRLVHYWGSCAHPEVTFGLRCKMELATKYFNNFQSLVPVLLSDTFVYFPLQLLALPDCTQVIYGDK